MLFLGYRIYDTIEFKSKFSLIIFIKLHLNSNYIFLDHFSWHKEYEGVIY